MIVLDENIPEDQCELLRGWRIRFRQIGQDIGQQGLEDEQQIIPLLHRLSRPTFFTRDMGFFDRRWCHPNYALVCLAISQNEVARFVRRFLRQPSLKTKSKRLGAVYRVSADDIRAWRLHSSKVEKIKWSKKPPSS